MSELAINTIHLGDAYKLIKQVPDKSVDLIYTDIPYSFVGNGLNVGGGCFGTKKRDYHSEYTKVAENSNVSGLAKRRSSSSSLQNISYGIDFSILEEFCRVLKHIYIYIWCSKEQILPIMNFFINEKHCFNDLFVWAKTNPIPTANGTYLPDLEYCLMFREKGTKIGGTYHTKSKYFVSSCNKDDKNQYEHPTCKPVPFIENHLTNSVLDLKTDDYTPLVLDPFCGSASTLIACKHLKINYMGFEIEKKWVDIGSMRLKGENIKGELNLFDIDYE